MKRLFKILVFILIFFSSFYQASAQDTVYPERPQGFVNDFADIIDNDSELELMLESYEKQTSNEIAIATIQSIGEVSIEEYAVTLFEKWGIGKQDKDNGILLLVALDEKKVRIEVGYGLEGVVPDSVAGSIIRNEITPKFAEGKYSEGITDGVNAIIASIGGEYSLEEEQTDNNHGGLIFLIILAVVVIFIIIITRSSKGGGSSSGRLKNTSKNTYSRPSSFGGFSGLGGGGHSSGGSFGGFGGGRSGGGGASGGW